MSFILTAAGRELHIAGPGALLPDSVPTIDEIAHSLAQINRFCGHACWPYSVAEHSLLVAQIALEQFGATPSVQLAALLHDAHECVVGDVSTPIKERLGSDWSAFEWSHARALRRHYGVSTVFAAHHELLRACDLIALATERRDLMPYHAGRNLPWAVLDSAGARVEPYQEVFLDSERRQQTHWTEWRDMFVSEFAQLTAAIAERAASLATQAGSGE